MNGKSPDNIIKPEQLPDLTYVLITPARNEEKLIESTIKCLVNQTLKPEKWVIVSDGSTDRTDEIVNKYVSIYDWIQLVRVPPRQERDFAAKVKAFRTGYAELEKSEFDIVGNMDADITFENDFFEFLIRKFAENPRLGIGGAPFREGDCQYDFRYANIEHVSGACLLWRRKCYEDVGGYNPIKVGGEEIFAGLSARMKGWQTRTFTEKTYQHHRWGNVQFTGLNAIFKDGFHDYRLGMHPIWEIVRFPYKMSKSPIIIGGILHLLGFFLSMIKRDEKFVSEELIRFRRKEQMKRLKKILINKIKRRSKDTP